MHRPRAVPPGFPSSHGEPRVLPPVNQDAPYESHEGSRHRTSSGDRGVPIFVPTFLLSIWEESSDLPASVSSTIPQIYKSGIDIYVSIAVVINCIMCMTASNTMPSIQ